MDTEHHYSASAARKTARQILDEIPAYRDMDGSTTEKSPNYWLGQLKQMLEILLEAGPATVAECDRVIKQALAARSRLLGETSAPVSGLPGSAAAHEEAAGAAGRQIWHDLTARETSEPVPPPIASTAPEPDTAFRCGARQDKATCTRTRGHMGGHIQHHHDGTTRHYWPRPDDEDTCPRCDSPDPAKHPAMQFEGEVQPCPDPWHTPTGLDAALTGDSYSLPAGELASMDILDRVVVEVESGDELTSPMTATEAHAWVRMHGDKYASPLQVVTCPTTTPAGTDAR